MRFAGKDQKRQPKATASTVPEDEAFPHLIALL
jgi:hypothetical protein